MTHGGWPIAYMHQSPHATGSAIDNLEGGEPFTTPVVGFRAWKLVHDERGYRLAPKFRSAADGAWTPLGPVIAECGCRRRPSDGQLINPDKHECGFYSYKQLYRCLEEFKRETLALIGVAVFWGRMWEHEHGYRAYRAQPVALLDPQPYVANDWWREIPLPALPLDDLVSYARLFGYVEDQEWKESKAA